MRSNTLLHYFLAERPLPCAVVLKDENRDEEKSNHEGEQDAEQAQRREQGAGTEQVEDAKKDEAEGNRMIGTLTKQLF